MKRAHADLTIADHNATKHWNNIATTIDTIGLTQTIELLIIYCRNKQLSSKQRQRQSWHHRADILKLAVKLFRQHKPNLH